MTIDHNIVLHAVSNDIQVEELRVIRNSCRQFMTRNTDEISPEQQKNWFANLDKSFNKVFLVYEIYFGAIVNTIGYGYIRMEDDYILLTGGLIDSERGKGYGSKLFELLLQQSKQYNLPIKLEVLKTNMRAFVVYNNLGFRVVSDNGKMIRMEYHYDSVI